MKKLQRDFESYYELRIKLKNFEETMNLRELTASSEYLKLLKQRERLEKKIKTKRKLKIP
jgi:hypothetical protein